MDNYKSIADPASHWTRQGKRQRARTHEECLSCTQVNFHLSCVFPLAILKIWHFGNNAWMKSKKTYQFGFLITSVWTQTLTSPSLTSHPSFSIPTLAALFQTHKCTGLGGEGEVCLLLVVCFSFIKNLCIYTDIDIKPCSPCSIHILTSLTRYTQPLHLAFLHASWTPHTLELILN